MDISSVLLRTFLAVCATATLALAQGVEGVETLWDFRPTAGYIDSSPAIGDLDGDGQTDLVVTTTAGSIIALDGNACLLWQRTIRGPISIPPTVADVTADQAPEVLVVNKSGQIFCLDGATGDRIWDWALSRKVEWGVTAIAVSDLTNDGLAEIITGDSRGTVVSITGEGEALWTYEGPHGWTLCPAIGDLDGNGTREIVVGGTKAPLICLSGEGTELWRVSRQESGSSPVICDLDGDGQQEILVGMGEKLAAVSGQGEVLWTHNMKQTIDGAISVADADGDGRLEIYAADLSGLLVCVSPDGELRWSAHVEERVRRSPSIADVDGDGEVEILVAGYSAALHVFSADGHLEERIPLSGACNATATVADLMGDGRPCIICPVATGRMTAFRWPGARPNPTVLWPEYRLNSARTAALIAKPEEPAVAIAEIDFGDYYVGSNIFSVRVSNPEQRNLTVRLEMSKNDGRLSKSVLSCADEAIEHQLAYTITGREALNLSFACIVTEGEKVAAKRTQRVHVVPFMKELADMETRLAGLAALAPRLPDPTGIEERAAFLRSKLPGYRQRAMVAGTMPGGERRMLREEIQAVLTESAGSLSVVRAAVEATASSGRPIVLSAANPWAPFDGLDELVEGRALPPSLTVEAFHGEAESAALNLFNLAGKPRTFRITLDDVESAEGASPVPAKNVITLHEAVEAPTKMLDLAADALPTLNQASVLAVPAWGARQLWLNVDSSPLAPGAWSTQIRFRSLEVEPLELCADLAVTVWPTRLPDGQSLRSCQWGYVHSSVLKNYPEVALEDQVAHGTNVFVGLFYPKATYDENGELVGGVDFAEHDEYVRRHAPHGIILFCGYQQALTGPGSQDSPAYRKAHVAWLRAWVKHLAELGLGYGDFALYPVDEPGLRDGLVETYLEYAKLAREADPNILMYTDPVQRITMEELERMAPYVDIWCPNRGGFLLEDNADKLAFLKSLGKTMWTYECAGNAKHQSPLGYYRSQAWLAWHHGLTGIGFWSYCTSQDDPWYRPQARDDYLLIYQGDGVVTSKRWEAVRDGIEDYDILVALKQAAERALARGELPGAVAQANQLLGEGASAIAQFCGIDENDTIPGAGGLPAVRRVADQRWQQIQATRREMARLLSLLQRD